MHKIKRSGLNLFQRLWEIFAQLIYTISGITSEFHVVSYLGCNSTVIRFYCTTTSLSWSMNPSTSSCHVPLFRPVHLIQWDLPLHLLCGYKSNPDWCGMWFWMWCEQNEGDEKSRNIYKQILCNTTMTMVVVVVIIMTEMRNNHKLTTELKHWVCEVCVILPLKRNISLHYISFCQWYKYSVLSNRFHYFNNFKNK